MAFISTAIQASKVIGTLSNSLSQNTVPAKLGDNLNVDVVLSKETMYESIVSENPVETGFIITDHVQRKPIRLSMEVVFTPTTLDGGGSMMLGVFGASGTNNTGRLSSVMNAVQQIYKKGEPIKITLPDAVYENMVMISAPLPRRVEDGICYRTQLEFQQVIIVSPKTETIPPETAGEGVKEMAGDTEQDFGEAEIEEIKPSTDSMTSQSIEFNKYEYYGVDNEEQYKALYGSKDSSLVADKAVESVHSSLTGTGGDF